MVNKILNWFWRNFLNPYDIDVQGWCPRQAEGVFKVDKDVYFYYFRARGKAATIEISKTEDGPAIKKYVLGEYQWPDAGYLEERECIKLATRGINKFLNEN